MAALTWSRVRGGVVDPVTGAAGEPTIYSRVVDAAGIFPGQSNTRLRTNALFLQDARKVLIAGEAMDPDEVEPGDQLVFEETTWTVYEVKRLAPDGGAAILFTVFCERGG